MDYSGILNKLQQLAQAPGTGINPDFLTKWAQNWTDHWGRINELRGRFGHPPIPIPPMPGATQKQNDYNGQRGPYMPDDPAHGRGTYYPKPPSSTQPGVPVPQITPNGIPTPKFKFKVK